MRRKVTHLGKRQIWRPLIALLSGPCTFGTSPSPSSSPPRPPRARQGGRGAWVLILRNKHIYIYIYIYIYLYYIDRHVYYIYMYIYIYIYIYIISKPRGPHAAPRLPPMLGPPQAGLSAGKPFASLGFPALVNKTWPRAKAPKKSCRPWCGKSPFESLLPESSGARDFQDLSPGKRPLRPIRTGRIRTVRSLGSRLVRGYSSP